MTSAAALRRTWSDHDRNRSVARHADQALRLLLIRDKSGPLPWVVEAIMQVMAPVDLVQVKGLPNALWRLGRERFDSVLLDVDSRDRHAIDACRRHIADIAAIPVLDLGSDQDVDTLYPQGAVRRAEERALSGDRAAPRPGAGPDRRQPRAGAAPDEGARPSLWPPRAGGRRAHAQHGQEQAPEQSLWPPRARRHAAREQAVPEQTAAEGSLWPPRAGKRRAPRGRPAHLGGAPLEQED